MFSTELKVPSAGETETGGADLRVGLGDGGVVVAVVVARSIFYSQLRAAGCLGDNRFRDGAY